MRILRWMNGITRRDEVEIGMCGEGDKHQRQNH